MTPVDLVIVEGFKRFSHPKLEVHRRERGTPLLAAEDASIVALATDEPMPRSAPAAVRPRRRAGHRRLRASSGRHLVDAMSAPCPGLLRLSAAIGSRCGAAHALLRQRIAPVVGRRAVSVLDAAAGLLPRRAADQRARRARVRQRRGRRLRVRLRRRDGARPARAWPWRRAAPRPAIPTPASCHRARRSACSPAR